MGKDIFEQLDAEFHFTLDAAASVENAKCDRFFTKEMDALKQDWGKEVVWCNPPGHPPEEIEHWVRAGMAAAIKGATVVMLLPLRTHEAWFHTYCVGLGELRFLQPKSPFLCVECGNELEFFIMVFRP